jgi:hypothetical protein
MEREDKGCAGAAARTPPAVLAVEMIRKKELGEIANQRQKFIPFFFEEVQSDVI